MAVFVDSSIQIAKIIRERTMKAKISTWLSRYGPPITGLSALLEFKRRVLRDVAYLLAKLAKTGSYRATLDYVTSVLPAQLSRKQRICVPLLHRILDDRSDRELTERARLYLRTLLITGEDQFRREWKLVEGGLDCYWARFSIRERRKYVDYELGGTRCSRTQGECAIGNGLLSKIETCTRLLNFLQNLPTRRLTNELESAKDMLARIVRAKSIEDIRNEELCLKAGDLILALDSEPIRDFYSMNYRESQAYCDFFEQNLTIRPNDPDKDEQTFLFSQRPWPFLKE